MQDSPDLSELLASLLSRAQNLLDEVHTFNAFLPSKESEKTVETRQFQSNVKSEVKSLSRVSLGENGKNASISEDDQKEARNLHMLHSTNLPFYEAVWTAAKHCQSVQALGRRIYWSPKTEAGENASNLVNQGLKPASKITGLSKLRKSVLVDVVARNGLEWVKVSIINPKRILFEIAKEGWETCADSEDEAPGSDVSSEKPDLQIIRVAKELRDAALHIRVQYQHPEVRLLLPNVREGEHADIDSVLEGLRKTGVSVECGAYSTLIGPEFEALAKTATAKFETMLPSPADPLTDTVNVDCTILLALISDISHVQPSALHDPPIPKDEKKSHHPAILVQISAEERSSLLLSKLYPVLVGRNLVCTRHAAKRACEIVETMGTRTEMLRAALLLGQGDHASMNEEELRGMLQQNSVHPVPHNLRLKIAQVDFEPDDAFHQQSINFPTNIAKRAIERTKISHINRSVFLYGWHENIVTVTSNQAVAGILVHTIQRVLDDLDRASPIEGSVELQQKFRGPQIWVCENPRCLIGKLKGKGKPPDS